MIRRYAWIHSETLQMKPTTYGTFNQCANNEPQTDKGKWLIVWFDIHAGNIAN